MQPHPAGVSLAASTFTGSKLSYFGGILAVVIPVALWFMPLDLEPRVQHALAITSFMIICWLAEALDASLTGIIGCYLFWAMGVAPFQVAFAGFATETPWFLLGAILLGTMVTKSGLGRRIAYQVMGRVGGGYAGILLGLIVTDFLLTFVVPSGIARIVIMAAIALRLLEAFGMGPGSNIARGMFIILTYTATIFDKMIIAGSSAITARGFIMEFGKVEVLWSHWFLAYLPCDLITIFVAWRLTLWLYPPEKPSLPGGREAIRKELEEMGPWTPMEIKSVALMLVALGLWGTDFLHHLSPALIGLGAGLVATLPRIRLLTVEDVKRVNYLPVFFSGAAISMGYVLNDTQALDLLTDVLFSQMGPLITGVWSPTVVLYWFAFVYHIFLASENSMLSTSIPLLMNFAKAHGLNPLALGMIWTFAAGGKIFIYQSGVIITGYSYGCFQSRDLLKVGFALTLVESIILLLLVPFYWPLIGLKL